jgi:hypothetical protein
MKTEQVFEKSEQPEALRAARVVHSDAFQGAFWKEVMDRLDIEERAGKMVEPRRTGETPTP